MEGPGCKICWGSKEEGTSGGSRGNSKGIEGVGALVKEKKSNRCKIYNDIPLLCILISVSFI